MEAGTAADWTSAGVNAVLAGIAVFSAIQSHRATKRADEERDRAERALAEDRRRRGEGRRAQFELEAVVALADNHGSLEDPNVSLRPFERGQVTTRLAALPDDRLPLYRGWFTGAEPGAAKLAGLSHKERWRAVATELQEELRRLGKIAAS